MSTDSEAFLPVSVVLSSLYLLSATFGRLTLDTLHPSITLVLGVVVAIFFSKQ